MCTNPQKNNNNLHPSPAIDNQRTIDWDTKVGGRQAQNAIEAAQDASITENPYPVQGKQLMFDIQNPPPQT